MRSAPIAQVPVSQLSALVAQLSAPPGAPTPVLLDVREAWELDTAKLTLPGTRLLHIPMNELPARLAELDPAQPVLGLCHHGVRSLQCVAFLQHQGFDAVYNIAGGIHAWSVEVDTAVPRY